MQTLGEHGRGDQLVFRCFLVEFLVRVLIEKNKVVGLLLDLESPIAKKAGFRMLVQVMVHASRSHVTFITTV